MPEHDSLDPGCGPSIPPVPPGLRDLLRPPLVGGGRLVLIRDATQPGGLRQLHDPGPPDPRIPPPSERGFDERKEQVLHGPFSVVISPAPPQGCAPYSELILKRGRLQEGSCVATRVCYEVVRKPAGSLTVTAGGQIAGFGGSAAATQPDFDYEVYQVVKGTQRLWELQQRCYRTFLYCELRVGPFDSIPRLDVRLIGEDCTESPYWQPLPPIPCISERTLLDTFDTVAEAEALRRKLPQQGPCP